IHETRKFPDGFLWGAATSSHQVEGGNAKSDWSHWEQVPGHILDNNPSGSADDQYHLYEKDFDMAAGFHQNAHRLSLEWSRIEPEDGRWDMDEVLHYRKVLEALKKRNMAVMLTVWHFTLPKWLADKGGWEWRESVDRFRRFAAFAAAEYADLVDFWITINEPMVYLGQSYQSGIWPPGVKSNWRSFRVFGTLCRAHRAAYDAIHKTIDRDGRKAKVGIAQNVITFEPYNKHSLSDILFIWFADKVFNHQFFIWTKGEHDFIGINYYFHYRIKYIPSKIFQVFFEVHTENREVSDLGWELNPQGIFEAVMDMSRYRKPIYITENGLANADDGKRPRILIDTIKEIYHAVKAGADVRGYFHWSLIDNYEWERGFAARFGLIAVDYASQKRTPRRSAYVYADICRENGIPHTLLRFLGHGVRW
ncbi:MAG: family 1 glycosylhydrolase, partial [Patescibacteria group bacterium]